MVEIIDNALSDENHEKLYNAVYDETFLWQYNDAKTKSGKKHDHQMVRVLYRAQTAYAVPEYLFIPNLFAEILDPYIWLKVKVNLTLYAPKILPYKMHRDMGYDGHNFKTAIYYINDNNGKTLFETGEEVESVANRLVIFDEKIKHTGTTHTDVQTRCVLNMNYIAKPQEQD